MKKANRMIGIVGIALAAVLCVGCVTAFAAGADKEAGAEEPAPVQSESGYLTGQRRSAARNRKNKAVVSGLGLSIAKEILTAHKAEFGVDNKDGCTFWFVL